MGKDLKAKLSQDVYTALRNIQRTEKELGGGRSKKDGLRKIDETGETENLRLGTV